MFVWLVLLAPFVLVAKSWGRRGIGKTTTLVLWIGIQFHTVSVIIGVSHVPLNLCEAFLFVLGLHFGYMGSAGVDGSVGVSSVPAKRALIP